MKRIQVICQRCPHLLPTLFITTFKMPFQTSSCKFHMKHFHDLKIHGTTRSKFDRHKYVIKVTSYSRRNSSSALPLEQDTIFSLSSGHGKCGVAVVRVSGPAVKNVLKTVGQFRDLPAPRKAYLRKLVHPEEGHAIDNGLVIYFPKPHSFTGQDCVELQVHGGPAVLSALLSTLHAVPGCRQADPGEFTKRAFVNGKLDLTEVEGLGDLIHAETEAQRRQALRQMDGDLSRLYGRWRQAAIKCVADLEAFIDFGEEQHIEDSVVQQVDAAVKTLRREVIQHINDNRQGERLREGVHVVIIGEPNVGKSSLLNVICQRPAAIVTDVAGTTRDVIDTPINLGGYPVLLSDTAGLRVTEDVVEKEGVTRAQNRARQADIVVLVFDLSKLDLEQLKDFVAVNSIDKHLKSLGIIPAEINSDIISKEMAEATSSETDTLNIKQTTLQYESCDRNSVQNSVNFNTLVVLNKCDLLTPNDLKRVSEQLMRNCPDPRRNTEINAASTNEEGSEPCGDKDNTEMKGTSVHVCSLSCIHGNGMEEFLKVLKDRVAEMCGNPLSGHPSLTQARHRSHLVCCLKHLHEYDHMTGSGDLVLASHALRLALWEMGKVTGKVTSEEILDVIFKDFCIGK